MPGAPRRTRFLSYFSRHGVELLLERFGISVAPVVENGEIMGIVDADKAEVESLGLMMAGVGAEAS